MQETADCVNVMVRCRPLSEKEQQEGANACLKIDPANSSMLTLDTKPDPKYFTFDCIAGERTTQEQVFNVIGRPIANSCLQGYNCCIFAYGQTGAGKTFTIQGPGIESNTTFDLYESERRGIVPRVFEYLFARINEETNQKENIEHNVRCSYLEIYNEHIIDLLNSTSGNLQVREDLRKGVYVEGLTEEHSNSYEETIELLRRGNRNRHIGSTNMNIESSRSHSVFCMTIESKVTQEGIVNTKTSRFSFVDLAGSERQKQTSTTGERLKEGCNINKSLSVLGNVINGLVDISEGKARHIHYRDSKLTFILRDSLGGNSKTAIIANVSPASTSFGETLSTLKFAQRAKLIQNRASINEDSSGTIDSLKKEIKRLKEEITDLKQMQKEDSCLDAKETILINNLAPEQLQKEFAAASFRGPKTGALGKNVSEMEMLLKQSIDVLGESEMHLQKELAKRDDLIEQLKSFHEIYQQNELQMRMVIKLQNSKLERFQSSIHQKFSEENLTQLLDFERMQLQKENKSLHEIMENTPTIMRVFSENLKLKERLECSDFNSSESNSRIGTATQLKTNITFLQQLSDKLDTQIRRSTVDSDLDEQEILSRSTHQSDESWNSKLEQIRTEYHEKIEQLNVELFDSERFLHDVTCSFEKEKELTDQLKKELTALRSQKDKADEEYEQRINEMLATFDQIKQTKLSLGEAESQNTELNLKLLEVNERCKQEQDRAEELFTENAKRTEQLEDAAKIRINLQKQVQELVEAKLKESLANEQALSELQIQISALTKEKEGMQQESDKAQEIYGSQKDEVQELEFKLTEFCERYNNKLSEERELIAALESSNREKEGLLQEKIQLVESEKCLQETLSTDCAILKEKIRTLVSENDQLHEENQTLKGANQGFREQVQNMEEQKEVSLSELNSQQEAVSKLKADLNNLNHLLVQHREQFQEYKDQVSEKHEQEQTSLMLQAKNTTEELMQIKAEKQSLTCRVEQTDAELDLASASLNEIRANLEQKCVEHEELEGKIQLYEEQAEDYLKENESLRISKNETEEKLASQITSMTELRDELDQRQRRVADLEALLSDKKSELQEIRSIFSETQLQSKNQDTRNAQLYKDLEEMQEVKEGLEEQVATLVERYNTQAEESSKLRKDYNELMNTMEKQKYELEASNQKLSKQLQESKAKHELEISNQKLSEQLQVSKAKCESVSAEALNQVNNYQQQISASQQECSELVQRLNQQEETHRSEFESQENRHTDELHKLYEKRKQTLEEIAKKKDTQLEEISNTYIKKLTDLQDELNASNEIQQDLSEKLDESQEQIDSVKKTNKDLQSHYNDISKSYQHLKRKYNDEVEAFKNEINKKNDQLHEANQFVGNCRSEIQEWKANIELKNNELNNVRNSMQSMELAMRSLREQKRESWCDQENEIIEIKEQSLKLKQENKSLTGNLSVKDSQLRAIKEEIKELNYKLEAMREDLKNSKMNEMRFKKENQEMNEKISKMNNEQYMLLMEIENITKANESAMGITTNEQKIRHLNKLKEENSRLRGDKLRMAEDLLKMQEQRDKFQKRCEEISRKTPDSKSGDEALKQELEKRTAETSLYSDAFCKVIQLLQSGLSKEEIRHYNLKSYDIETVIHAVQSYANAMMEKNKYIHSKETELESSLLKNSILEKELLTLKQKMQARQHTSTTSQYVQMQPSGLPLNFKSPNLPQNQQYYTSKTRSSSVNRTDGSERGSLKGTYNDENREELSKRPPRRASGLFSGEKRF